MKQLTVQIPDNKFSFIVELLNQLGVKDVHENDLYIPDWQKELVRERIKNHKQEEAVSFEEFEAHMKLNYEL